MRGEESHGYGSQRDRTSERKQSLLTNPGPVKLHVERSDQAFQERPDQLEVDASDAPGAVHQDDDVRRGSRLTRERLFS